METGQYRERKKERDGDIKREKERAKYLQTDLNEHNRPAERYNNRWVNIPKNTGNN